MAMLNNQMVYNPYISIYNHQPDIKKKTFIYMIWRVPKSCGYPNSAWFFHYDFMVKPPWSLHHFHLWARLAASAPPF